MTAAQLQNLRNPITTGFCTDAQLRRGDLAKTRRCGPQERRPYRGPPAEPPDQGPDQGPDPLDVHGRPRAPQPQPTGEPEPGSPDWHRKLAAWCDKWIAEGEDPNDLDDALRMTIREEIADRSQVEAEFEKVKRLVRQQNGAASVPFMITQDIKRRLRVCGYSDEQIAALTPQEAHELLARQGWRPGA